MIYENRHALAERGAQFSPRQLREREIENDVLWTEVQGFLKRLRRKINYKRNAAIRYFGVLEPHKSGDLHAHLLLFEAFSFGCHERDVRSSWQPRGHAQAKLLIDGENAINYVAPYVAKSEQLFVRASKALGSNVLSKV